VEWEDPNLPSSILRCAWRVVTLLGQRRLHIDRHPTTTSVELPDGRRFSLFRQTHCDPADPAAGVTLAVWFHLKGVPAGARVRRWLFERESILNTILYAGMEGYQVKLWLVDPTTSDYAGLYSWDDAASAARYGRYISAVLRPLSRHGSVGFTLIEDQPFARYLEHHAPPAAASPPPAGDR
jgi:hypothetical protein